MKKYKILLSFGGNLPSSFGDPMATIRAAYNKLSSLGCEILDASGFYRTRAITLDDQANVPDFCNSAAVAETRLSPDHLLDLLHEVEGAFGRKRAGRWNARTLDIDLVAYSQMVLPNANEWFVVANNPDPAAFVEAPMVPHPRMHKRGFVLVPLLEVAPEWCHPLLGSTVRELHDRLASQGALGDVSEITAGHFP